MTDRLREEVRRVYGPVFRDAVAEVRAWVVGAGQHADGLKCVPQVVPDWLGKHSLVYAVRAGDSVMVVVGHGPEGLSGTAVSSSLRERAPSPEQDAFLAEAERDGPDMVLRLLRRLFLDMAQSGLDVEVLSCAVLEGMAEDILSV